MGNVNIKDSDFERINISIQNIEFNYKKLLNKTKTIEINEEFFNDIDLYNKIIKCRYNLIKIQQNINFFLLVETSKLQKKKNIKKVLLYINNLILSIKNSDIFQNKEIKYFKKYILYMSSILDELNIMNDILSKY